MVKTYRYRDPAETARLRRTWSHRLALLLSGATLVLLGAGALVTGTGSSLAVPDWPLAYGQLFPPMVGGILYEHGHRLIAAAVGLLTIAVAAWLWRMEPRTWVRRLGLGLLGVIVAQGLLGGITVLLLLPKVVSISHALLAQVFFLLTVVLAQVTAPGWEDLVAGGRSRHPGRAAPLAAATTGAVLFTVLLGAVVRHFGAGLAIPDFPLAYGRVVPPLGAYPIVIHFLHRVGALVTLVLAAATLWEVLRRHRGQPALVRPALVLAALLVVQIALGGGVIWSLKAVAMTTLHLVNGALLFGAAGLLTLRAWLIESAPRPARTPSAAESPAR